MALTRSETDKVTSPAPPAPASSRTAAPRPVRRELGILNRLAHIGLALWAAVVIVPLLFTFVAAFKSNTEIFGSPWALPHEWRIDNWARAWSQAHIGRYVLNTVVVVSGGVALTMLLGSLAAYILARYTFPGNRFLYYLFVSGMTFPMFLALVPLFFVVDNLGLLGTHTGLVLVYAAYALPFTVFFLAAFFKSLPSEVAEAATIDGAGHWRIFFTIMMPMAKPALVSITIFNVIGQANQYVIPLILLPGDVQDKWVLTQGVANISTAAGYEADWGALFAALSISIIPMIAVYAVFQRQIQSGLTAGSLK
ncbi:carbohydrate ABC transporter permease [Streptomyces sp. FIT100]|uniref:carbohydrate ABC transporter permease n=1 Tax=Streptomyces sp. FIT100 TaxID=2837956 RepID=UPI0021CA72CC|nr:carbohydrate ABC transporter permease [Streptomyces sp. FIT100]UUN25663.1 carbohydrate ABC transporter permease [Streptomyces sp. FIT100]